MCGIMASKGKGSVEKVLIGLKKLEYRGYDSCGIAYKQDDSIAVIKSVGYVDKLIEKVGQSEGDVVIGHTRWATHGGVTVENSHPHISSSGRFAIVHNGIIENYNELKDKYLSNVDFSSETDSEVIAQLMDRFYVNDIWKAFKKTISKLKGSFAIVMLSTLDNNIYFSRHQSPMVISQSDNMFCVSSDVFGCDKDGTICYLDDDTIGYYDGNVYVYDKNFNCKNVVFKNRDKSQGEGVLNGFRHYMCKEIYEIPQSIRSTYEYMKESNLLLPMEISHILIVGCGTSYHSGMMGCKYIEEYADIPCECIIASEFVYNKYLVKENTLAIFISQSGETADTLTAINKAKDMGMYTLAVTNVDHSSITRIADSIILMQAGAEICVASTKAYTTQLFVILMLSNILINVRSGNYNKYEPKFVSETLEISNKKKIIVEWSKTRNYLGYSQQDIDRLFKLDISKFETVCDDIANKIIGLGRLHLIGKSYDYITAMEGALKIKEVSYIMTDAYPSGELKHGTLSLIDDNSVVLSINTCEDLLEKGINAIHEIEARGGEVVAISGIERGGVKSVECVVDCSGFAKMFRPIVAIVPIDLIAYKVAVGLKYNPDKPRNLAKSVTVE